MDCFNQQAFVGITRHDGWFVGITTPQKIRARVELQPALALVKPMTLITIGLEQGADFLFKKLNSFTGKLRLLFQSPEFGFMDCRSRCTGLDPAVQQSIFP